MVEDVEPDESSADERRAHRLGEGVGQVEPRLLATQGEGGQADDRPGEGGRINGIALGARHHRRRRGARAQSPTAINPSTMNTLEKMATLKNALPLGRMPHPRRSAAVVAFLAGDCANLAATTISADGGIMQSSRGLYPATADELPAARRVVVGGRFRDEPWRQRRRPEAVVTDCTIVPGFHPFEVMIVGAHPGSDDRAPRN